MYILSELEPEMIKLLKLASFLSIVASVIVVTIVGIGLTRDNETVSGRAQFLSEPTIIDKLREIEGLSNTKKDNVSPLVTQSIEFALRIDPPIPPRPSVRNTGRPNVVGKPVEELIEEFIPEPPEAIAKFKLIATSWCQDYPEKSLALLDITSKGQKWVRQGETVERQEVRQINDGSILLYKGGRENGILRVPKKKSIGNLLQRDAGVKTIGVTMSEITSHANRSAPPTTGRPPASRDAVKTTPRDPRTMRSQSAGRYSRGQRPGTRKLPDKPTDEQLRNTNKKDISEMNKNIGKGSKTKDPFDENSDLMKMVRELLKSSAGNPPPQVKSKKTGNTEKTKKK